MTVITSTASSEPNFAPPTHVEEVADISAFAPAKDFTSVADIVGVVAAFSPTQPLIRMMRVNKMWQRVAGETPMGPIEGYDAPPAEQTLGAVLSQANKFPAKRDVYATDLAAFAYANHAVFGVCT